MIKDMIAVTISGSEKHSLLHGPVAAIVTVRNVSAHRVEILLPYPNPNHLVFGCKSEGSVKPKQVEREKIERTIPIRIDPGSSYTTVYYLNRYFSFLKAGRVRVSYRLELPVTRQPGTPETVHEDAVFEGEFTVQLIEGTEKALREELARHAAKLESKNRQEKMQAAEALAFLDTPAAVDYVARMLKIDNLEVIGIRSLGRFPSAQTDNLLLGMLSHKDSAVVGAALREFDRQKRPVPRVRVQNLLTADNPNTRWLALEWLAARPDPRDLPLLGPLLEDKNPAVRKQAQAYAEGLRKP
jgi:hypothetical protein